MGCIYNCIRGQNEPGFPVFRLDPRGSQTQDISPLEKNITSLQHCFFVAVFDDIVVVDGIGVLFLL